jgi:hypothetical protein
MVYFMVSFQHLVETRGKSRKTSVSPGTRIGTGISRINKYATATFSLAYFFFWIVLRRCQYAYYTASNGGITGKWQSKKDLEGSGCGQIELLFWNLPGGTEKNLSKDRRGPDRDFNWVPPLFGLSLSTRNSGTNYLGNMSPWEFLINEFWLIT